MSEKSEKATPYKLQKAKEEGKVAKSIELNTSVFLLVTLTLAAILWPRVWEEFKPLSQHLLSLSDRTPFSVDSMAQLHYFLLSKLMMLWLPFAVGAMVTITVSSIAQTGLVWSTKPLTPDFKRLSISAGFKRFWSSKLLFDALKNTFKLALVIFLFTISVKHELPSFLNLIKTQPNQLTPQLLALLTKKILQLLTLLFALALIDKLYTQWKFAKDNRMSKQELKDEYRQREGDPKIKAKIKQVQRQLRQQTASLENLKTADVMITDRRHCAVALKYERGQMPAPKVVCKAQGEHIKQVQSLAIRYNIPIIENPSIAQILFADSTLNHWIHKDHFPKVAMIFRDLYLKREMK